MDAPSEIADFYVLAGDEDVLGFYVSVDYAVLMEVL